VKNAVTRLKGHATLWWDELHAGHRCKGKRKIKSWDSMVAKLKDNFIPKDNYINMFRKLQNLRQKSLSMKEYTKEFYRMNITVGQKENDDEKIAKYINGLRCEIKDNINMMPIGTVEDAYHVALKVEEKLARRQSQ
jgi:hypothetical protein